MKYSKTVQIDGQFYVMRGNTRYFPDTASDSELEAQVHCNMKSIEYHLEEARKLMQANETVLENIPKHWSDITAGVGILKDWIENTQTAHPDYDMHDPCTWM